MVGTDALFAHRLDQLIALAARHRLPTMYALREATVAGGLMSYGENVADFYRRAPSFVDKIFKGAKPGDFCPPHPKSNSKQH